jgi:hypothetical protein
MKGSGDALHVDAAEDRRGDLRDLHGAFVRARGVVLARITGGAEGLQGCDGTLLFVSPSWRARSETPRDDSLWASASSTLEAFDERLVHVLICGTLSRMLERIGVRCQLDTMAIPALRRSLFYPHDIVHY